MSERYASLLLFGAPGVGKGTQGKLLGAIPGLCHLATGDMFRGLDRSSELGRRFVEYSSKGLLVPDDLTIELWKQHVRGLIDGGAYDPRRHLLVLDGIPRRLAQGAAMDGLIEVLKIIHLMAPDIDELVARMRKRAAEQGRHDDTDESVVRRRFEVYDAETQPVLAHYPRELVASVDATGTPIEVLQRVLEAVVPSAKGRGNPLE